MSADILLLTDIIEPGDTDKEGLYLNENPVSLTADEDALNQRISLAIDSALPEIKRQLHQELFAALSEK
jgi:hypothetical protein